MNIRSSGVLLHITSLPSRFGIGDLGPAAYDFADFLRSHGQLYWQFLPTTPTTEVMGNSPYASWSAFAGNPLLDDAATEVSIEQALTGTAHRFAQRGVLQCFPLCETRKRLGLERLQSGSRGRPSSRQFYSTECECTKRRLRAGLIGNRPDHPPMWHSETSA